MNGVIEMLEQNLVDDKDIQIVLEGFQDYMNRNVRAKQFHIGELELFMEPIFEHAGYRSTQGGD